MGQTPIAIRSLCMGQTPIAIRSLYMGQTPLGGLDFGFTVGFRVSGFRIFRVYGSY